MANTLQVYPSDDSPMNVIVNRTARFSIQSQPIQLTIDSNEQVIEIQKESESVDTKQSLLNCLTMVQVVAMMLIVVMFALDIYTLYFSLYVISRDEVAIHCMQMVKFRLESSDLVMNDADKKALTKLREQFPSMFSVTLNSNISLHTDSQSKFPIEAINLLELNTKMNQIVDQKSSLIIMIVITLMGLVMHLVGLVGAIRLSFTLTLLETLNVVVQVALKHSTTSELGNFYIIWPIYSACLPAFVFCQIKLYYVKIKQ